MPWKRKQFSPRKTRLLFLALSAAVAGGILAALFGALLHERGSALAGRYFSHRSLLDIYFGSGLQAAPDKNGAAAR